MIKVTKWFGITETDAERGFIPEENLISEIEKNILLMQAKSAKEQNRSLRRGTHAKGICVRGELKILPRIEKNAELKERLQKGIFAKEGKYPVVIRFANADSNANRDSKPDVRSLSLSVDLTGNGGQPSGFSVDRQDFSMQNATVLPINDATAFLAITKVLAASNPAKGLIGLSFKDKLRVFRTLSMTRGMQTQPLRPYQVLRYHSNTPYRHGTRTYVKYCLTPSSNNKSQTLDKKNPNCLQDELIRHLSSGEEAGSFDFGIQFLDIEKMTYRGKHYDTNFWLENASVEWHESESPFYTLATLTLLPNSNLSVEEGEKISFDVMGNTTTDSLPVGSINRARQRSELASKHSRLRQIQ
jgi:catalase